MKPRNPSIVCLKQGQYEFNLMEEQIKKLQRKYPFLKVEIIGKSIEERPIYCLSFGEGKRKIHANGSHHANEWITSFVLMKSIELLCQGFNLNRSIYGQSIQKLFGKATYDVVPMVNPDGIFLSQGCLNRLCQPLKRMELIAYNEGLRDFSRWKANIRGVDLNRNYDAGFEAYSALGERLKPSYSYYQGPHPESEPESKAIADLTRRQNYDLVLAYHTQGEVIYWTYDKIYVETALEYAKMFSRASGYLLDEPEVLAASGGYKDWFIKVFQKPGFTIECGRGENPIDSRQGVQIVKRTLPILLLAAKEIRKEE